MSGRVSHVLGLTYRLTLMVSLLVVAGMAIIYLPRLGAPRADDAAAAFTRAEFITIILTAVTVVLAALAIVLALAGTVGYVTIREAARVAAEQKAIEVATIVATRTAEQTATTLMGGRGTGDEIARAVGNDDAK